MGKFAISVVALFIVSMGLGFVVHATLLGPEYAKLPNLFRQGADAEKYFVAMLAVQPMPEALVVKQIVFDSIAMLVMGSVVAFVNR